MSEHSRARTSVIVIGGMQSSDCVRRAEAALRAVPGVENAHVNLLTRLSTVRHAPSLAMNELTAAIDALGFRATAAHAAHDASGSANLTHTLDILAARKARFIAGAVLTALIFIANTLGPDNSKKLFLLCALATPVQLVIGWEFYVSFFRSLRRLRFNLDGLGVIAATAAYTQGMFCFLGQVSADPDLSGWHPQFHSGALLITALSLGKWLEALARDSAEDFWGGIEALLPREACVLREEREQIIPAGAVALGDIVLVGPGERIPVDGEVVDGFSHVDQSALTGDARPISKVAGDRVAAAGLNGSGVLRIRATAAGPNSTLAHISMLVERARCSRCRSELMTDRIAAVLAPTALLIAVVTFLLYRYGVIIAKGDTFSDALRPALSMLIAACPVALGLAAPAAIFAATRVAARRGMFFKGGGALEAAGATTDVVFDQSGTLTSGAYRVKEVLAAPDADAQDVLALAAGLGCKTKIESARCIDREARRRALAVPLAERCEMLPGGGVLGHFGAHEFWLCPRAYIKDSSVKIPSELAARAARAESEGTAVMFLCREGETAIGALTLEEHIKEGAPEAIESLRKMGVAVHLLSGEPMSQARLIGRACGLSEEEIHAMAGAEGKAAFTREMRSMGRVVAVVGDGASDAPALAIADVGIALSAGADAATEAAGIVLASGEVMATVRSIESGRAATRVIRQNLVFALACTAVMMPLAFFNKVIPAAGVLVLAASTLAIVANSMRLAMNTGAEKVREPRAQPQTARRLREVTR